MLNCVATALTPSARMPQATSEKPRSLSNSRTPKRRSVMRKLDSGSQVLRSEMGRTVRNLGWERRTARRAIETRVERRICRVFGTDNVRAHLFRPQRDDRIHARGAQGREEAGNGGGEPDHRGHADKHQRIRQRDSEEEVPDAAP